MLITHDYMRDNLPKSFQNVFKVNRDVQGIYETRQAHLFYIPWTNPDLLTNFHPFTSQKLEQLVCTIRCLHHSQWSEMVSQNHIHAKLFCGSYMLLSAML